MTDTAQDTKQETIDDATAAEAADKATEAAEASVDNRTDYMVLYAPVPEDDDHEPRYREAGYVRAHDGDGAIRRVRAQIDNPALDKGDGLPAIETRHANRILEAAEHRGVFLRAVPIRSWREELEPARIQVTRAWA